MWQNSRILQLLEKADSYAEKAIVYFIIGTKLNEWPREAYFPFFKAIELISNKLSPELEKRFKVRIQNACEVLGIKEDSEKIDMIVNTRNRSGIAHATLKKDFKKEPLDTCRELARVLIVNYIKRAISR